ncbi:MAG TPA: response regulator [Nitrososphaeraceae archaeon]|jgi:CheY-like chemotaxis protein
MNILIAEDERDIALLYKEALEARKHKVTITHNGEECLKKYHDVYHNVKFGRASSQSRNRSDNDCPFEVLVLDYRMPQIDGFEVAKEILAVNSHQRIIFASAHVKETLEDSIKQLKQVVELMQKPFTIKELIDTIEDKEVYTELQKLNVDLDIVRASKPTHEQIMDLLERLRKIEKMRTF